MRVHPRAFLWREVSVDVVGHQRTRLLALARIAPHQHAQEASHAGHASLDRQVRRGIRRAKRLRSWLPVTARPDEQLVSLARGGDADAFEELLRRHSPRIYRLLARLLGDPALAEDATQETFVRAWRALSGFRGEALFSTWLFRIAVNEGNRMLAREARRENLPFDDVMLQVPDLTADTPRRAEAGELQAHLERWLAELPAHYRAAVVLRDVEGLSNEEAAGLLGLEIRNFKSRLHRGRMALRRRLEQLYDSG